MDVETGEIADILKRRQQLEAMLLVLASHGT
jgi:hypothetical protein